MLHENPDRAAPFPVDDHGRVPLQWFADVSVDPDGVLALYNDGLLLPADSVDRVWLSQDDAWVFWEEMLTRQLAKLPAHRFKESPEKPAVPHPDADDEWVTFKWE